MAATCTEVPDKVPFYDHCHQVELTFSWVAHTDGAVTSAVSTTEFEYTGYVTHFITKPGATTAYNITLYDDNDRAIATKTGADTSLTETHTAGHYIHKTKLYITVASAGSGGTGTAIVMILTR